MWPPFTATISPSLIGSTAMTIRADRCEPLQIAPQLAGVETAVLDQLEPCRPPSTPR